MLSVVIFSLILLELLFGDLDFTLWNNVVSTYVSPGEKDGIYTNIVNYSGISTDTDFYTFQTQMANLNTTDLNYNDFYALFINAYNCLTINLLIENACIYVNNTCKAITSIWDIGPNVFDIYAGTIGGVNYTLNEIEDLLRHPFKYNSNFTENNLLHSCIVCGGVSCPNVKMTSYNTNDINYEMQIQMEIFLNNTHKGSYIDELNNVLFLSKIFSWYSGDFVVGNVTSIQQALLPYMNEKEQNYVKQNMETIEVKYFVYDWKLNGQSPCQC